MITEIKYTAFGKNDIRGIYGVDVTEDLFFNVGKAYIKYIQNKTNQSTRDIWVTVSKDARNHSTVLAKSLIKGIVSTGANVIDLGLVPTPLGYYSEFCSYPKEIIPDGKVYGALIVTASHNPSEYNGLKMTFNKSSLTETEIKELKQLTQDIVQEHKEATSYGVCRMYNILNNYLQKMTNNFSQIGKGIKVVVDSANATGGVIAPKLYRELGCEVIELYSEPDGNFPNHHPNPSDEKTLDDIKKSVVENNADFGIAFDGDADRIGVIDSQGQSLTGDKLLLIYALDIIENLIKRGEKPVIVSEVKCSQVLYDTINRTGAKALMCKTGHGYIKAMMKAENAILAGEMSGHTFFKDRYYGFDDAVYAGCRIIEIVAKHKKENKNFKVESLLSAFDNVYSSREVRFHCENDLKKVVLSKLEKQVDDNPDMFNSKIKEIITIDGMRIVFDGGFALIRQSNTEPVFTLRFEAQNQQDCDNYEKIMISALEKIMKDV